MDGTNSTRESQTNIISEVTVLFEQLTPDAQVTIIEWIKNLLSKQ